jgi:tripartite ATP-independent transporter DctM subunit
MIIYAYVMGESVAALFLAGIVPGIMVGLGLMLMVRVLADRMALPKAERIVTRGQTIAPLESVVAFALLRVDLAALLAVVLWGLTRLAGVSLPGLGWMLFALSLVLVHFWLVWLRGRVDPDFRIICKRAVAPLQTPIIILGGILLGVFTPTEAAAIAVAYALVVSFGILRSMRLADLGPVLMRAAIASAVVLLLVGAAVSFKTVVSLAQAPQIMADFILGLSENPLILLFLINILLFVIGMFLDAGPAIIILGPILAPIFVDLGVEPVHFAVIMSVNLTVGLATPPMGLVLFVASSVSGEKVQTISRTILPFLAVEVVVIFLVTFIPALSMTVPRLAGFVN